MYKFFLIIAVIFMSFHNVPSSSVKPQLIYVFDPMCSWCYGFSPELNKIKEKYGAYVEFKMVAGGLRPGATEVMDKKLKDFLRHHWEEISRRTSQPFSYGILEWNDFIYDTEPASRAIVTVRNIRPESEFEFFKAVQKAFYQENKNTTKTETYLDLIKTFDIDNDKFTTLFQSEEMKNQTANDFMLAGALGVKGFPALLLKKGDKVKMITYGYTTFEKMDKTLEKENLMGE